ncbi:MaoC/PaaZ C-terminal domain-containing protein [Micromonospora sp. NPDC049171]|uniref:MaoC/PaaZ C-terminal domain-containing protein n=1 Tax=Micromonospora sp. NPDC049171 TaxID=3155770 RepID=UPI0033D8BD79
MTIETDLALSGDARDATLTWSARDVQLYHLAIGAGEQAADESELRYVLEDRLQVLPSFGTAVVGSPFEAGRLSLPGIDVDQGAVLHGAQRLVVHRPLPRSGSARRRTRVTGVWDAGRTTVLALRSDVDDDAGPLWSSESELIVRGERAPGAVRRPFRRVPPPGREPDLVVECPTRTSQALLYRLCGDLNPLHADPATAAAAGFSRPVLHGLCSYGIALKAAADTLLDGEVTRIVGYTTRFAGVFYPGETLRVRLWAEPAGIRLTATAAQREDAPVLADAEVTLR